MLEETFFGLLSGRGWSSALVTLEYFCSPRAQGADDDDDDANNDVEKKFGGWDNDHAYFFCRWWAMILFIPGFRVPSGYKAGYRSELHRSYIRMLRLLC